uniref:Uncharacterized protein n=1 Tax=Rhizophora mucronata TaxID=61149 RepID=A0A2P2NFR1_RHIMU
MLLICHSSSNFVFLYLFIYLFPFLLEFDWFIDKLVWHILGFLFK